MVCVFLFGANDSFNTIVPTGTNPNLSIYETYRAKGVRVNQEEVLPLSGNDQWGLHPNLSNLQARYDAGKVAIVFDVGVLNEPTIKTNLLTDKERYSPLGLFAHNTQVDSWGFASKFKEPRVTGWFGRYANLADPYFNPDTLTDTGVMSVFGATKQNIAYIPKICPEYPGAGYPEGNTFGGVSEATYDEAREFVSQQGEFNSPFFSINPVKLNLVTNAFRDFSVNNRELQQNLLELGEGWFAGGDTTGWTPTEIQEGNELEAIFDAARVAARQSVTIPDPVDPENTKNVNPSPDTLAFINTMRNVARGIYARKSSGLNQRRQAFYAGLGGFDQHTFLREGQDPRLNVVDIGIKAFWDALDKMNEYSQDGVNDNVVLFTESDFGRTLRSNGSRGTDHAWSGHHIVMGTPVTGGFYGEQPNYTLAGPRDIYTDASTSVGRFIPQISIEQYYAPILKWMDIPEDKLGLILPALSLYDGQPELTFL